MLMVPVALAALALLAAVITGIGSAKRRVLLWVSPVLLLGFCAVGIFSIGFFYLPVAVALIASAVMGSRRTLVRERQVRRELRFVWTMALLVGPGVILACQRGPDIYSQEGMLHMCSLVKPDPG